MTALEGRTLLLAWALCFGPATAARVPKGQWILGRGWDEGAWANHYPGLKLLSEKVPDHPVFLASLHGFAGRGNRLAFARAGITRDTRAPEGGEIVRDQDGNPTDILLNRADCSRPAGGRTSR